MGVNQRASMTMMWIKQLTTSTFSSLSKGIDRIDFIRRNKKSLLLMLLLWCVVVLAGSFGLKAAANNQRDAFFSDGVAAVEHLGEQASAPLLGDDALGLIRITSEFEKSSGAFFAAILNHENKIVAHSDPDLLNQPYTFVQDESPLQTIGQVLISAGHTAEGVPLITFARNITYSNVKIGSAIYGVAAESYFGIYHRYRIYVILLIGLCTVAVVCGALLLNRRSKGGDGRTVFGRLSPQ
jgi:hypothetical protein